MQRRIIPDVIDGQQALSCLTRDATAADAAKTMAERHIGAVMIVEHGRLLGIVTERDMVTRLVALERDPRTTSLAEMMTAAPQTLSPNETVLDALKKMQSGNFRHLPVVEDGILKGMVSVRDLYEAVREELEEGLRSCEAMVYGDHYGVTA